MSLKVMQWVWNHSRSKNTARLVLLAIADCAHDDGGNAFPSVTELMRKSRSSERSVQTAVKSLVALGELDVRLNGGPRGCNRYRVLMGGPPQEMPPADSAGADSAETREQANPSPTPAESAPRNSCPPQKTTSDPAESAPGTVREPSKSSSSKSSPRRGNPDRPDVEQICAHLADRIEANGSKRPTITAAWRDEARLLIDKDGREVEKIMRAIDWCQNDPFWHRNILSMPKLREKYDQLRLAARASPANRGPRPSTTDARVNDALALAEELRREAEAQKAIHA